MPVERILTNSERDLVSLPWHGVRDIVSLTTRTGLWRLRIGYFLPLVTTTMNSQICIMMFCRRTRRNVHNSMLKQKIKNVTALRTLNILYSHSIRIRIRTASWGVVMRAWVWNLLWMGPGPGWTSCLSRVRTTFWVFFRCPFSCPESLPLDTSASLKGYTMTEDFPGLHINSSVTRHTSPSPSTLFDLAR